MQYSHDKTNYFYPNHTIYDFFVNILPYRLMSNGVDKIISYLMSIKKRMYYSKGRCLEGNVIVFQSMEMIIISINEIMIFQTRFELK